MRLNLTYAQWFALLTLKHFSPECPSAEVRAQTLRSLVRRGLATQDQHGFWITSRGVAVENFIERAPAT